MGGDFDMKVALMGVGSAALVCSIYHCITLLRSNRRRRRSQNSEPPRAREPQTSVGSGSTKKIISTAPQLIPAHKYKKGVVLEGLEEEREDGICPVCLCEFEEGEELRTLPECLHSFHAPCIDMWLYSHPSCPICRSGTAAALPLHVFRRATDSSAPEPNAGPDRQHSVVLMM